MYSFYGCYHYSRAVLAITFSMLMSPAEELSVFCEESGSVDMRGNDKEPVHFVCNTIRFG